MMLAKAAQDDQGTPVLLSTTSGPTTRFEMMVVLEPAESDEVKEICEKAHIAEIEDIILLDNERRTLEGQPFLTWTIGEHVEVWLVGGDEHFFVAKLTANTNLKDHLQFSPAQKTELARSYAELVARSMLMRVFLNEFPPHSLEAIAPGNPHC